MPRARSAARLVRSACAAPCSSSTATSDAVRPLATGAALAEATGGTLVTLEGAGHCPHARDPVKVNLLLRDFVCRAAAAGAAGARAARAPQARAVRLLADRPRPRPARRGDRRRAAPAAPRSRDRLARAAPGHRGARGRGERIHPASAELANESAHIESESAEHDLHCFQALRRMDEILVANFMVFHDVVRERAVRPVDRRRGVGGRLLPAREPRAEARRLRAG